MVRKKLRYSKHLYSLAYLSGYLERVNLFAYLEPGIPAKNELRLSPSVLPLEIAAVRPFD